MILLTGAAGKTGRAILRALAGRGQSVRAFVRRAEQAQAVQEAGANAVAVGDLRDAVAVARGRAGHSRGLPHLPQRQPR